MEEHCTCLCINGKIIWELIWKRSSALWPSEMRATHLSHTSPHLVTLQSWVPHIAPSFKLLLEMLQTNFISSWLTGNTHVIQYGWRHILYFYSWSKETFGTCTYRRPTYWKEVLMAGICANTDMQCEWLYTHIHIKKPDFMHTIIVT
jgi:hypothetical protein